MTNSIRCEISRCACRIAWVLGAAYKAYLDPMMMVGIDIAQQYRRGVNGIDDYVCLAIVE